MTPPPVAHGYTIHDLDTLAKYSAKAAHGGALDGATRYQTAWSAIAEHLVCADQPPTRRELVHAGRNAITTELAACLHARGYLNRHAHNGPYTSPRYMAYWRPVPDDRAEDRLVDYLAAVQIGEMFTAADSRVVTALAIHDDHQRAAEALGMEIRAFECALSRARRRFLAHWYAPDTPPARRRRDRRRGNQPPRTHCSEGHELVGENVLTWRVKGGKTVRACRRCARDQRAARRKAQQDAA